MMDGRRGKVVCPLRIGGDHSIALVLIVVRVMIAKYRK